MNLQRSMSFEKILTGIRIRQQAMAASKPDKFMCTGCGRMFEPEWDRLDCQWRFLDITETGLCRQCLKVKNIRENIESVMKDAGIPLKHLDCTFENFHVSAENRELVNTCWQYVKDHNQNFSWLYVYGSCGTGKTHISVSIARELLLLGKRVMFTCVPQLCYNIRQTFQVNLKETEQDVIKPYITCDYLILDDLGIEKPTEWVKKTIGYIIYERDNNLKPTIITSNLALDDIAKQIGMRNVSRLVGNGPVIRLRGPDRRLEKRRENSSKN
jgi:DNA replication protein DnaC